MGLVNVYKMSTFRPFIPYRYKAEIWNNYDEAPDPKNILEFTVKSINQPVFKLNTENKVYFGNTAFVIPIFKFGETSLEITFEETDDMTVFSTLAGWLGTALYKTVNNGLLNVRITQYSEDMTRTVDSITYICRIKDYSMPNFNNNGFGAPIEITANFNVVYVLEHPKQFVTNANDNFMHDEFDGVDFSSRIEIAQEDQKIQDKTLIPYDLSGQLEKGKAMQNLKTEQIKMSTVITQEAMIAMGYDINSEKDVNAFNNVLKENKINADDGINNAELSTLVNMINKNHKADQINDDLITALKENINVLEEVNNEYNNLLKETTSPKNYKTTSSNKGGNTDFVVTDTELTANLKKIHSKGYTNVSMETLRTVSVENATRMSNAYNGLTSDLSNTKYSTSINTYNDPGHEAGIGSDKGSHLTGQKVDLTFYKNGKKITKENSTAEDREFLSKIAKQNGLIINWESSDGSDSGWGDVALSNALSINNEGKIENIKIKPWTKENQYYDSKRKKHRDFNT